MAAPRKQTALKRCQWNSWHKLAWLQDAGDTPVPLGTTVNLVWGGEDGLISTTGDNVTYSTSTDAEGTYHFCGVKPDADENGTPDQFQVVAPIVPGTPVTAGQGGNDYHDSDGTPNGNVSESPIFTIPSTITAQDDATNDVDPTGYSDDETDLTIDFGFVNDGPLSVTLGYAFAETDSDGSMAFAWETVSENGVAGFNLYVECDCSMPPTHFRIVSPV